jgi:putative glutamine amidotransferase
VVVPSVRCDYLAVASRLGALLDGLLLTGGGDIHPRFFGEEISAGLDWVSEERDEMELALARVFLELDKPILGICRGCQVLNVAAGGSLFQDIESQVGSARNHRLAGTADGDGLHEVSLSDGSRLEGMLGCLRLGVNSKHHQAVKMVAPGFEAVAWAEDGIVEAIESRSHRFALAVQWHPEDLFPREDALALFQGFVSSCREGIGCQS